jgi:N-acyl-D-amino-acid deacylase
MRSAVALRSPEGAERRDAVEEFGRMTNKIARSTKFDKSKGLEFIVHKLTQDTASTYGLHDRRGIAPGYQPDLSLIDFEALKLEPPEMVYDLPRSGKRLIQKATGYAATIKSGEVTFEDGEATGALPGRLLRGQ